MEVSEFVFYLFALLTVVSALAVVTLPNVVHAAFSLMLIFLLPYR